MALTFVIAKQVRWAFKYWAHIFCILAQVHTWTLNAKLVLGEMLHMIVRRIEPGSCNLSLGNQAMANADAEHAIVCSQLSKDYVQVHDHYV